MRLYNDSIAGSDGIVAKFLRLLGFANMIASVNRSKQLFIILIIISVILFYNLSFSQPIPYNQEFVINTHTENWQRNPSVIRLLDNNIVVCWDSHRQDGEGWGVFAQMYDSMFTKLGEEFNVNSTTAAHEGWSDIAALADGGFVISWNKKIDEWLEFKNVNAQIFDSKGIKNSPELRVTNISTDWHSTQNIASLSNNRFILNWANNGKVYAQQYDIKGSKIHQLINFGPTGLHDQDHPGVASLPNGCFVIIWPHENGIYAQRYDSTSKIIGGANVVSNNGQITTVQSLSSGGYAVSWCVETNGNERELYLRIYGESGQPVSDKILVDMFTYWYRDLTYYDYKPRMMQLRNGKILVSWVHINGNLQEIYSRIFENDGEEYGSKFKVTDNVHDNNAWIDGCAFSGNKFFICWSQMKDDNVDIYGKYYVAEPLHHDLTEFQLIDMVNDSIDYDDAITLQWQQASEQPEYFPWEVVYDVYISPNNDFWEPVLIKQTVDTNVTIDSLAPGKDYYWRVLAKNIDGDSLWSTNIGRFFVRKAPDPDDTIVDLSGSNYWIYDYYDFQERWDPPVPDVLKNAVVKSDIYTIYYKDNLKYATIRNTFYYDTYQSERLTTWKTDSKYLIISNYFTNQEDTVYFPLNKQGIIIDSMEISDKVFLRQKVKSYYHEYIVYIDRKHTFETIDLIGPLMMNFRAGRMYSNLAKRWELSSAFVNGEHFHIRPHRPIAVKFEILQNYLKISWHKNLNENVIGYHIYGGYSSDPDSLIATMTSRQDTVFMFPSFGIDSLYFFGVTAFTEDLIESKKNIIHPQVTIRSLSPNLYLYQNYPNPFNSLTIIGYYLNQSEDINLTIFDIKGAKIKNIYSGKQKKGFHEVRWEGRNHAGIQVAQGLYIYELNTGAGVIRKKMVLVK